MMEMQRLRRPLICLAATFALTMQVSLARAQIYEWVDEENDRHFVNSLDQVPNEQRGSAKMVVGAATQQESEAPAPLRDEPAVPTRSEREPTDEELRPYTSAWERGFDAGVEAAEQRAATEPRPEPSPVIIVQSPPQVIVNVPRNDPAGAYYQPADRLAVPFDDGASRGLTHRGRVQDLRALERGW
jgi:hypothetical protein